MNYFKRVLVLAPHTDDGELGCGATISRWIESGTEVFYAAFSSCRQSVPKGFAPDVLEKEMREATAVLGIKPENLVLMDYEVRTFAAHRQAILDDMVQLNQRIRPDCVLMPSRLDTHQDHETIAREAIRAFKHISVLGYELPWNNQQWKTDFFVALTEEQVKKKTDAVLKYQSQQQRTYTHSAFLEGLARLRGVQSGNAFAESFEVIRFILK